MTSAALHAARRPVQARAVNAHTPHQPRTRHNQHTAHTPQLANPLPVNIGAATHASGVSAKMIRHYESIGLVPSAGRTGAGYRTYTPDDLHRLRFVKRARTLGFPIKQIEALLALWSDRRRSSAKVKALTEKHIADLETRIAEMQAMKQTLQHLAHQCHGDARPDCPIIAELAR